MQDKYYLCKVIYWCISQHLKLFAALKYMYFSILYFWEEEFRKKNLRYIHYLQWTYICHHLVLFSTAFWLMYFATFIRCGRVLIEDVFNIFIINHWFSSPPEIEITIKGLIVSALNHYAICSWEIMEQILGFILILPY